MPAPPVRRTRFHAAELRAFAERALTEVGVAADDARLAGEVLVASDLRGVESHGVARLEEFYVDRIRSGLIEARTPETTVSETPASLVIDANNALGHPVSVRTMARTIEKAKSAGSAVATVRNSNHFGIGAYYAMLALEHDCIGIASTNSGRLAVPTGGVEPMLGTNPLAFAIPAEDGDAFVLDMATTTVALGKLEIAKRLGKPIESGWAVDADGNATTDPEAGFLGALLPLGGFGTHAGGHKGYGLGLLAEILCAVLGGGILLPDAPLRFASALRGQTSHFFLALSIERFREPTEFKRDLSRTLRAFRESPPAPGFERVYTAGEPEMIRTRDHLREGIGLDPIVVASLESVARKLAIDPPRRVG